MHKNLKIVFAGTAQNCSAYLPKTLNNIEDITSLCLESGYVFIENDSSDNTKDILQNWGNNRSNFHLINLDGLNQTPIRTLRLELARNTYLEFIKNHPILRNYDFLIVLDMDDVGAYAVNLQVIRAGIDFLQSSSDIAAIFANQNGTYNDMWALRHTSLCPNDPWEEVLDYSIAYGCSDEESFGRTFFNRICAFDPNLPPIEVNSAFGGIGIYKMGFVIRNPNPYLGSKIKILSDGTKSIHVARWQVCEHVHFHRGIRAQNGKLFIFPRLLTGKNDGLTFPPSAFRHMLF